MPQDQARGGGGGGGGDSGQRQAVIAPDPPLCADDGAIHHPPVPIYTTCGTTPSQVGVTHTHRNAFLRILRHFHTILIMMQLVCAHACS